MAENNKIFNVISSVFILFIFTCFILSIIMLNTQINIKDEQIRDYKISLNHLENYANKSLNNLHTKIDGLDFDTTCDCNSESYCYAYDDSDFDLLFRDNAEEHPYILNYYDCTEFAKEGARRAKNVGFRAKTKYVNTDCDLWTDDWEAMEEYSGVSYDMCKENDGAHLIVEINKIYVEATTGEIIMPYEYEKYGLK